MPCVKYLKSLSTTHHPNTNGLVEKQNSTIGQSLRAYCANDQDIWPKFLPGIMMSFRKSPHLGSTEYAPFELLFGQEMRLPFDATLQPKDNLQRDAKQYMKDRLARLKISTEIAKVNDLHNQSKNKEYNDQHGSLLVTVFRYISIY